MPRNDSPSPDGHVFEDLVAALLASVAPGSRLATIGRLSGGASQESWLIEGDHEDGRIELVMRRAPGPDAEKRDDAIGLTAESGVIRAVRAHGVPAPEVLRSLDPADGLGTGFVMRRVHGETVARRIFRDDRFKAARPKLARQCGEVLGRISQVPRAECPPLETWPARTRLDDAIAVYRAQGIRRPVLDYAFCWLKERLPSPSEPLRLVHGDFRNGNLIVDENGIAAVLDWEISHFGSPLEDLGWLCIPSWRFGNIDQVAGGFGSVDDLIEGFETAGGPVVDRVNLHFWTVLGVVQWGLVCIRTALEFRRGRFSVEPAVIGRRLSETELDVMMLTEAGDGELI